MLSQLRFQRANRIFAVFVSAGVSVFLGGCSLVATVGGETPTSATPTSKSQPVVAGQTALPTHQVSSGAAEPSYLNPTTFEAQPAAAVGSLYHRQIANPICTATVIDTPARNLAITAAHCVSGGGDDIVFRPGSIANPGASDDARSGRSTRPSPGVRPSQGSDDQTSHGTWQVTRVYATKAWIDSQSGADDVAVIALSPVPGFRPTSSLQEMTGGHTIWQRDLPNRRSTIIGYPASAEGKPVQCNARIVEHNGLPALKCLGASRALAGAPWFDLTDTTTPRRVMGVTGGHQRGGCDVNYAYTPTLGDNVVRLIARALRGEPGDTLPSTGDSPCPAQ